MDGGDSMAQSPPSFRALPFPVIPSAPLRVIPSAPMHVIPSAAEESKALAGNTTSGRRPLSTYLTRP